MIGTKRGLPGPLRLPLGSPAAPLPTETRFAAGTQATPATSWCVLASRFLARMTMSSIEVAAANETPHERECLPESEEIRMPPARFGWRQGESPPLDQ